MLNNTSQNTSKNPEEDDKLNEMLVNLPEYAPKRDLWIGIEQSLVQTVPTPTNQRGLYAIAASICLVAILGFLATTQHVWLQTDDHKAGLALVDALSAQHAQTKTTLLVKYNEVEPVAANWQAQLSELDSAAEAVKKALKADPNNRALLKMLQYIYQQQIDVIEKSHATTTWQQI